MANDPTFLELIQLHERRWGSQGYPGRPTLKELMECPIVAVWFETGGFTLSIYESADQINEAATYLFTTPGPGSKKLVKIFYKRQPMAFTLQIIRVQPPAAKVEPPRFTEVKEIGPTRYGESAPARNQLFPGRKTRLLKGRK